VQGRSKPVVEKRRKERPLQPKNGSGVSVPKIVFVFFFPRARKRASKGERIRSVGPTNSAKSGDRPHRRSVDREDGKTGAGKRGEKRPAQKTDEEGHRMRERWEKRKIG